MTLSFKKIFCHNFMCHCYRTLNPHLLFTQTSRKITSSPPISINDVIQNHLIPTRKLKIPFVILLIFSHIQKVSSSPFLTYYGLFSYFPSFPSFYLFCLPYLSFVFYSLSIFRLYRHKFNLHLSRLRDQVSVQKTSSFPEYFSLFVWYFIPFYKHYVWQPLLDMGLTYFFKILCYSFSILCPFQNLSVKYFSFQSTGHLGLFI